MEIRKKIIEYIRINKVSTTEVADCLGKTGALPNVMPVNRGQFHVGKVKWVYAYNESNWDVHARCVIQRRMILYILKHFSAEIEQL